MVATIAEHLNQKGQGQYLIMQSELSIPVVIIAGGLGRRIGGNKMLHKLSGQTLLDRALQKASSYSSRVAVSVGRHSRLALPDDVTVIFDEHDESGPISGLSSALSYAVEHGAAYVLVMPCDTPFLPEDLMRRLHASIGEANVAVAHYDQRMHSACALWRVGTKALLPVYLAQGRRSLTGFAQEAGYIAVEWPPQPFDPFFNINTVENLASAELILEKIPTLD